MAIYEADYLFSDNESVTSIDVCGEIFTGSYTGNVVSATYPKTFSEKIMAMENITISSKEANQRLLYFTGESSVAGIKNSVFSDNKISGNTTAALTGGVALVASGASAFIEGSLFENNTLDNTADNGNARGAAIYFLTSTVNQISGSTFSGNSINISGGTTTSGGAIYNAAATVNILGSTFYNNFCNYRGGAIYNNRVMTIDSLSGEKTVFDSNSSVDNGGAVYAATVTTAIKNVEFLSNDSDKYGGAIYFAKGGTVNDTIFSENTALRGAAIYSNDGNTTISNSIFTSNTLDGESGGAIWFSSTSDENSITGSTFSGNKATLTAGAIYNAGAKLSISGSTFSGNKAGANGGAIYMNSAAARLYVEAQSVFDGNLCGSGSGGGAISVSKGDIVSISGSTFSGNVSDKYGGALLFSSSTVTTLTVTGSTFSNNIAGSSGGGAIYLSGTFNNIPEISDSVFSGNTSKVGAAIRTDVNIEITGSTFAENYATDKGVVLASNGITISGCTFSGNTSTDAESGVIHINGASATAQISDTVFDTSYGSGYALYVESGTAVLSGNIDFLDSSDNIFVADGAVLQILDANVNFNSSVTGTVSVTDSELVFNSSASFGAATFSGSTIKLNNGSLVTFAASGQSLTGTSIVVNNVDLSKAGTITLAENVTALDDTITVNGTLFTLGSGKVLSNTGLIGKASLSKGVLSVNVIDIDTIDTIYVGFETVDNVQYFADDAAVSAVYGDNFTGDKFYKANFGLLSTTGATEIELDGKKYIDAKAYTNFSKAVDAESVVVMSDFTHSAKTELSSSVSIIGIGDSKISGVDASASNGSLYINGAAEVSIKNLTFENNYCDRGGAIYSNSACNTLIENCTFSSNKSNDHGGAVYMAVGDLTIKNSRFYNNKILSDSFNGGAIYAHNLNTDLVIDNSVFDGNSSLENGGAIRTNKIKSINITGSTFSNNDGFEYGGAIAVYCSTDAVEKFVLSGSTFVNNISGGTVNGGGAVYLNGTFSSRN